MLTVALAGNPNSGKTTMFNALTGARQKVGNYPGVTVERREGMVEHCGNTINFVDLPGIYSLSAYSPEELVARKYLIHEQPHVIVVVVDSTALERSLYFIIQLMELNFKVIIALNMIDEARKSGIEIDCYKLEKHLKIKVVPTIAREGVGKVKILDSILSVIKESPPTPIIIDYGQELEQKINKMEQLIKPSNFMDFYYSSRIVAVKYLEKDSEILKEGEEAEKTVHQCLLYESEDAARITTDIYNYTPESIIADQRYGFIASIMNNRIYNKQYTNQVKKDLTEIVDRVLTSPFMGLLFLTFILYSTFWFSINLSETPMSWIESIFGWLETLTNEYIPQGLVNSLITNGILNGVGAVLSFVPIISLMFIAIALLEDSGYMARMSYMLDRVFRVFGLHGNSIVAMVVSGGIGAGCAVPGVMATRTLRSHKEKAATIITAPIMSCGAKLPVFTILSATFFPNNITEALFIITTSSWVFAFGISKLLRSTIIRGASTPFLMELPPYRLPTLKCLLLHAWERVWQYIKKAGTVILAVSIILWAAMSYPLLPDETLDSFNAQRVSISKNSSLTEPEKLLILKKIDNKESEMKLENSYAGRVGKSLEPISRLSGFDWKINIALVGGFAAKEVIVSTLSTALAMGNIGSDDGEQFVQTLRESKTFNLPKAISLILFTMLYAPCFVTVVVIGKEIGLKWAVFSIFFNTLFAFMISSIFYQVATNYFSF